MGKLLSLWRRCVGTSRYMVNLDGAGIARSIGVSALLLAGLSAHATMITGTVKSVGGAAFNGTVRFTLSHPGQDPSQGALLAPTQIAIPIRNGQVPAGYSLSGNDVIQPSGTYYLAQFFDLFGKMVVQNAYRVTGTTFDIGAAVPSAITTSNVSVQDLIGIRDFVSQRPVVNVRYYGADPSGSLDSTTAIQNAINFAKSSGTCAPLYFPSGNYKVSTSLNMTTGCIGWQVYGDSKFGSTIRCGLAGSFPCMDFTGTQQVYLHDLQVVGAATGAQSAAVLIARDGVTGLGDEAVVDRVVLQGLYAKSTIEFATADLNTLRNSDLYNSSTSGTTFGFGATDFLGVGSAYRTFNPGSGDTQMLLTGNTFQPRADACVRYQGGSAIYLDDNYCAYLGTTDAYVRVTGTGGNNIYMTKARGEYHGTAANTYVIDVTGTTSQGSSGGVVECSECDLHGNGAVFLESTGHNVNGYTVSQINNSDSSAAVMFLNSGTGGCMGCILRVSSNMPLWSGPGVGVFTASSITVNAVPRSNAGFNVTGATIVGANNFYPLVARIGLPAECKNGSFNGINLCNGADSITPNSGISAENHAGTGAIGIISTDVNDNITLGSLNHAIIPPNDGNSFGVTGQNGWNIYSKSLTILSTNSNGPAIGGLNIGLISTSALISGQVVKIDSANASSVAVTLTTDTGAGLPVGIVSNSPGAGNVAFVTVQGVASPTIGTGTCTPGQFVVVDTTTNGRIKCTSTYAPGTIIGRALSAGGGVGTSVNVLVNVE